MKCDICNSNRSTIRFSSKLGGWFCRRCFEVEQTKDKTKKRLVVESYERLHGGYPGLAE